MPLTVHCPHCRKPAGVPEGAAGKQARCPSCSQLFTVEAPVVPPLALAPEPEVPELVEAPAPPPKKPSSPVPVWVWVVAPLATVGMCLSCVVLAVIGNALPKAKEQPGLAVTANELAAEYAANSIAADRRFKGKTLDVTGEAQFIARNVDGVPYVTFRTRGAFVVRCLFRRADDLASVGPGQTLTIRGTCAGQNKTLVDLSDCRFPQ